jgi:hypothetical protein
MQVVLGTDEWMWSVSNRQGNTGVLERKMSDCNLFTTNPTLNVPDSNGSSATTARRQTAWSSEGGPICFGIVILYWMFGGLNVLCFVKMWRLLEVWRRVFWWIFTDILDKYIVCVYRVYIPAGSIISPGPALSPTLCQRCIVGRDSGGEVNSWLSELDRRSQW